MTKEELKQAVEKPAKVVGLKYEQGLTAALLEAAGDEPGSLALLEFTLTQLWRARDLVENEITLASYYAQGGLTGSIDRHANAVFKSLKPVQQVSARRALMRLVHISTSKSIVRARRPLSVFSEEGKSILKALARPKKIA